MSFILNILYSVTLTDLIIIAVAYFIYTGDAHASEEEFSLQVDFSIRIDDEHCKKWLEIGNAEEIAKKHKKILKADEQCSNEVFYQQVSLVLWYIFAIIIGIIEGTLIFFGSNDHLKFAKQDIFRAFLTVIISIPSLGVVGDLGFSAGIIVIALEILWKAICILICLNVIDEVA
jgi:hypothetical protein